MDDIEPLVVGLCGAAVILGAQWLLDRVFSREPHLRCKRAVFFAFAFLLLAAVAAYIREPVRWRLTLLAISLFFLWASLGVALHWPGFRDPPPRDEDDEAVEV